MSVEEARAYAGLALTPEEREAALDALITEVRAEMPCYEPLKAHTDEIAADPRLSQIIGIPLQERDCGVCITCTARAERAAVQV